jgi:hypothetical protein
MSLDQAKQIASQDPSLAARLYAALRNPFALHLLEEARLDAALAAALGAGTHCAEAAAAFEPAVPWNEPFLRARVDCYTKTGDARAAAAARDLMAFRAQQPEPFEAGLVE